MSSTVRRHVLAVLWFCVVAACPATAADLPPELNEKLTAACGACHGPGGPAGARPLATLLSETVVPGFAEGSRLFEVLVSRHVGGEAGKGRGDVWPDGEAVAALAAWIDAQPATGTPGPLADRLTLATERVRYVPGDEIVLTATATADCHLTVISIDPTGEALVLLPNDLERDSRLAAGQSRRIPAVDAGYRLKAREAGVERIVAWCARDPRPLAGIRHAFGGHRFTLLGAWHEALAEMIDLSAELGAKPREDARRLARGRERRPDWQSLFADHAYAALRFETRPAGD